MLNLHAMKVHTEEDISFFPGVKIDRKFGGWTVPWHCVSSLISDSKKRGYSFECDGWIGGEKPKKKGDKASILKTVKNNSLLKSNFRLYGYQEDGLSFSVEKKGSMLYHPAGSGKTLSSIVWSTFNKGSVIVITKAPLRLQFYDSFIRFTNIIPFVIVPTGTSKKRQLFNKIDDYLKFCDTNEQQPYIIAGYEGISDNLKLILSMNPDSVIFDESHKAKATSRNSVIQLRSDDYAGIAEVKAAGGFIKNDGVNVIGIVPKDNIAKNCEILAKSSRRRLLITATPDSNLVKDWWAQLDLIEPGSFGTFTDFAIRHCDARPGRFTRLTTNGASNQDELKERLSYLIHYVSPEETHKELPPVRFTSFYISKDEQTKLKKDEIKLLESGNIEDKFNIASVAKIDFCYEKIKEHVEAGDKVFVFTGRRNDCERITEKIGKSKNINVLSAHGGTNKNLIDEYKNKYINHDNIKNGGIVFVGTLDLLGTGVDGLQCTNAVFYMQLPYTPGLLEQSIKRFNRIGQTVSCIVYFMLAEGHIDERIVDILYEKKITKDTVMNSGLDEAIDSLIGIDENRDQLIKSILQKLDSSEGSTIP